MYEVRQWHGQREAWVVVFIAPDGNEWVVSLPFGTKELAEQHRATLVGG